MAGALVVAFWGGLWVGAGWADVNDLQKGRGSATRRSWRSFIVRPAGALAGGAVIALLLGRPRRAGGCSADVVPEAVLARLGGRCAYCHDDAFGVAAPCANVAARYTRRWLEVERLDRAAAADPTHASARAPAAATINPAGRGTPPPPASGWPRSS
ncbi:MAG: hypothetical protein R3F62_20055 [Planctomycetota bacterium]